MRPESALPLSTLQPPSVIPLPYVKDEAASPPVPFSFTFHTLPASHVSRITDDWFGQQLDCWQCPGGQLPDELLEAGVYCPAVRVLMVSKALLVGAYQRKLEEMAACPDMELTVVVPPAWRDEAGERTLERAYLKGYRLVVSPLAFNGSYHLHFYPGLRRWVRETRPEILHIDEEPYNLATFHALRLGQGAGARTLFFSWQNLERRYPFPFNWLERYVLRHVDFALMGNHAALTVWRTKGYRGPARVVPQFGVDPDLYYPRERKADEGRGLRVGFAGRLVPEKGADLLLHAAHRLPGEVRVTIAGNGPAREGLERLAGELGLRDRVTFESALPSTRMTAFYHALDVLVVPSRSLPNWREQFGRVLVEAMACGLPVVGSDSGEIPEVIGDAGLVFPEGDAEALAAHLLCLGRDPALRATLAEKGRARVLARYTQARVAAETVAVYQEMLGLSSPPSGS